MKRLVAMLLVLCMVFSLVACKKPADNTDPSGNSGSSGDNKKPNGSGSQQIVEGFENAADNYEQGKDYSGSTGNAGDKADGNQVSGNEMIDSGSTENKFANNNDLINPAFAGKTLQVYGWSSAQYDDIEDMGEGNYIWMMRAAIDEWAAMNKVTVVFEGDYDQNTILGAINNGEKPDLLLHCNKFPVCASMGITKALTDEEYAMFSDITGSTYVDMLNYKGASHGIQYPWAGNTLFWYNETLFETYGVKSPKEYYMEGTWTWDNMQKCFQEITRDLDNDGKVDIYGSGTFGAISLPYNLKENNDGTLTSLIRTSPEYRKYIEIMYDGQELSGWYGKYATCYITSSPRPATSCGDAEWYNFDHLNRTIANGDNIQTIPLPAYDTSATVRYAQYSQNFMSVFSSCDETEATLALMAYILRVGMRYMSDYSLGLYDCKYEGMRGASVYSKGWKENFAITVADRQEQFDEIDNWDQECYDKMIKDISSAKGYIGRNYAGGTAYKAPDTEGLPPASSLPLIAQAYEAWVSTYNDLYAN